MKTLQEVRKDILGFTITWFLITLLTFAIHSGMLFEIYKELTKIKEFLKNENTNTPL